MNQIGNRCQPLDGFGATARNRRIQAACGAEMGAFDQCFHLMNQFIKFVEFACPLARRVSVAHTAQVCSLTLDLSAGCHHFTEDPAADIGVNEWSIHIDHRVKNSVGFGAKDFVVMVGSAGCL